MTNLKHDNWISIKDRLPSDGEVVLITNGVDVTVAEFVGEGSWFCAHLISGYEWEWDVDDWGKYGATSSPPELSHWMELPKPPKVE